MARVHDVFFVVPVLEGGGAERVLAHLAAHFDRARFHAVVVVGRAGGVYEAMLTDDVEVVVLGREERASALPRLVRLIWQRRPAMVVTTMAYGYVLGPARPFLPRETQIVARVSIIMSAHHDEVRRLRSPLRAKIYRSVGRLALEMADTVVCLSESMVEDARRELNLSHRANLVRIYNPVDLERTWRLAKEEPEVRRPGSPWIVCVARLFPQKGIDILLEALAIMRSSGSIFHVSLLGEGPERQSLERRCRRLGLSEVVHFAGFVENPYAVLARADLLVLASRYEGFANVILESLAVGCPVVATDSPSGNREVIQPGINGWLAPNEDPAGLAETIVEALEQREALRLEETMPEFLERFTIRAVCAQYEALIDTRE